MSAPIRLSMVLSGQVQGVGLRYRAQYAARLLGLTGWVMNCDDGTVLLEAQGTPEALTGLLPLLRRSDYIRIDDVHQKVIPTLSSEYGFSVRGW